MRPKPVLAAAACALVLPAACCAALADSFASRSADASGTPTQLGARQEPLIAAAVPEPPTYALLIAGIVAAGLICHLRLRGRDDDDN